METAHGSLYAVNDLLIGAKSITMYLMWHGGMFFTKNLNFLKFIFIYYI